MNWIELVDWLQKQGTLTIVLFVGVVLYLAYRGILKIPGLKKKNKGNPHAGCEHVHDAQVRIGKIMQARMRADYIVNTERVRLQMDAAELTADDIIASLKRHYLKLLKSIWQAETGLVDHADFRGYEAILKAWRAETLTVVRHMMRENNIPENDAEFEQYASVKTGKLIEHFTQFLNDYYSDGYIIKREQLYDAHLGKFRDMQSVMPEVKEKLYKFFRQAKRIYIDQMGLVKKLESDIEAAMPSKEDAA